MLNPMAGLGIAVLTVSDTRSRADDASGDFLSDAVTEAGHVLHDRAIVRDEKAAIQAALKTWVDDESVDCILITGGTGITRRDVTPEALEALIDKRIDGFGELFRWLSFEEIGTSTIQSRAMAGVVGSTLVFALPGSTGACRLAWSRIIRPQLDINQRPCNFAELMPRL